MARLEILYFVVPVFGVLNAAIAAPPDGGDVDPGLSMGSGQPQQRSPAIDAAVGTPPAQGRYGSDTYEQPGIVDRQGGQTAEKTYGSTARSYAPDGNLVEGLQLYEEDLSGLRGDGTAPEFHIVQRGDTLWEISDVYLRDPYGWPKLWSWNEHVTNAHWIFPGDRIRLRDPAAARTRSGPSMQFSKTQTRDGLLGGSYMLNQIAFVDEREFETAMKVVGGGDAKVMMATLDTVYMDYESGNPPVPGERVIVYAPQEEVRDPEKGKRLGYIVQIMGEIEVDSVAKKTAEGTVMTAYNPVERGYRVGPLRRVFRRVEATAAKRSAQGFIVATLVSTGPIPIETRKPRRFKEPDVLAGEDVFVITDVGGNDGVRVGNVLEVVRKGDEYTKKRVFKIPYEDGWPRRVIGRILVVEVQESTSLGVVVDAGRELERGDHVELRGPRSGADEVVGGMGSRRGRATGEVEVGDGKASVEGGYKFGK